MADSFLDISYDPKSDIVTIEGIKYSAELFRVWGLNRPITPPGESFRIISKEDGCLQLLKIFDYKRGK